MLIAHILAYCRSVRRVDGAVCDAVISNDDAVRQISAVCHGLVMALSAPLARPGAPLKTLLAEMCRVTDVGLKHCVTRAILIFLFINVVRMRRNNGKIEKNYHLQFYYSYNLER